MKDPRNEARNSAEHVAMNDMKGKPRTEGNPPSQRSDEFKSGYYEMAWSPKATRPNAYEVARNRLTGIEAQVTARKTR